MQKWSFIILVSFLSLPASASTWLQKADSLYAARQYTQAFEHYKGIFDNGQYSPAMLLKMAYIEEALHHLGGSLYYLNLYFLSTGDQQALKKMEELAENNNLKGYENSEAVKIFAWLHKQYNTLAWSIFAATVFLTALLYYQLARKRRPSLSGIALGFTLAVLFVHVNFSEKNERGIVTNPRTYLMSGPSSAASVVAIIGEGHQLEIDGHKDVWLKVKWNDKEAFVRENLVQPVRL